MISNDELSVCGCCCILKQLNACFFSVCYFCAGIQEFPENIKNCKVLAIVEASVNPISKWVQPTLPTYIGFPPVRELQPWLDNSV